MNRLGIVAALRSEVTPLTRRRVPLGEPVRLADNVMLLRSGMGSDNARAAARQLLQEGATALLSWGTAVALAPALHPGALVLAEHIQDARQRCFAVDNAWRTRLRARLPKHLILDNGPLLESSAIIPTPAEKHDLYAQTACRAADMESAALARAAEEAGVAYMVIRVIVDSASMTLPVSMLSALDEAGEVAVGRLLRTVAVRPRDWPQLWQLARGFSAATRTLRSVAQCVGPDFAL